MITKSDFNNKYSVNGLIDFVMIYNELTDLDDLLHHQRMIESG